VTHGRYPRRREISGEHDADALRRYAILRTETVFCCTRSDQVLDIDRLRVVTGTESGGHCPSWLVTERPSWSRTRGVGLVELKGH
jgi:hypothetical protein